MNLVKMTTLREALNLSKNKILKMVQKGELPCYRAGRALRFDVEECRRALKQERK